MKKYLIPAGIVVAVIAALLVYWSVSQRDNTGAPAGEEAAQNTGTSSEVTTGASGTSPEATGQKPPVAAPQTQTPGSPKAATPPKTAAPRPATSAIEAGRQLAGGSCSGTGPGMLTHSPMDPTDFSVIVPYGMVVGGHVTPIDHQYFSPRDRNSPRDAYPVYAMADSRLVDIQPRVNERGTEYRMVFSMTCTFLYYYDLVTSLAPNVKAVYEKNLRDGHARVDIAVKAGDLIGAIGGQTLDFAVWNTEKPLAGFIVPAHYGAEPWKIYTADPLNYYSPELKALALSRYTRTAEPISGKIDYDIDGRLIGNWFKLGTNGYGGVNGEGYNEYWKGHFSAAPDLYDPTGFLISLGDFGGAARQFAVKGNAPRPENVSAASGLVKYDLVQWAYLKIDGSRWDGAPQAKGAKFQAYTASQGCLLVELITDRWVNLEVMPGRACVDTGGFTSAAEIYER